MHVLKRDRNLDIKIRMKPMETDNFKSVNMQAWFSLKLRSYILTKEHSFCMDN